MTKKEQAEVAALLLRANTLAALRWTTLVERDIPIPEKGYSYGWDFNEHDPRIWKAWSGPNVHGTGHDPELKGRSASQRGCRLFSTSERALAALRHAVEMKAAATLLRIDQMNPETAERF